MTIYSIIKQILQRYRLRHLLYSKGKNLVINTQFEGKNALFEHSSLYKCHIGLCSYISQYSHFSNTKIGRFCSIADNVNTCTGNHPTSQFVTTFPAFYYDTSCQIGYTFHFGPNLYNDLYKMAKGQNIYQIVIGNDVWIGSHVLIMGGVTIGDGAIVAAGSVVTKDIQPYSIVGGVPAKHIKYRFSTEQINFLLDYKWWNFPLKHIQEHYLDYQDIDTFIVKKRSI